MKQKGLAVVKKKVRKKNSNRGGKREGAGRPPTTVIKTQLYIYLVEDEINAYGGKDKVQAAIYAWWNRRVKHLRKTHSR